VAFLRDRTDEGLTGYSEFGSDGITRGLVGLVQDLGARLIGKDPTAVEKHYMDLYRATRQAPYGATQQAIAGIELALWDLAGKSLGVPVYRLMGGPHRERQRVYWSHCATYRVENWEMFRVKPLRAMSDVADCAREAAAKGYTALKTNIIWPGDPATRITQGRTGPHDQLATRDIIDQAGGADRRHARGRGAEVRHLPRRERQLQAERSPAARAGARAVQALLDGDRQSGPRGARRTASGHAHPAVRR
jgi:L-alanine-DL-glutamate epimerase-like enolase superfamily enzyme